MNWLLNCPSGFSLFTDHSNLIYVFDPHRISHGLSSNTASKLTRWALKLCTLRYTIEHAPGDQNLWPDLLTRWAAPAQRARVSALFKAPLNPDLDTEFVWAVAAEIRRVQDAALVVLTQPDWDKSATPPLTLSAEGLYRTKVRKVWIPSDADDLQLRICIVAHMGIWGHRGRKTTTDRIKGIFDWDTLAEDVKTFCNTCLHCLSTIGGDREPRPLGDALHAGKPNELLHMDFLYMGPSVTKDRYLLLLKDDF
jgi:Integrase zinc binding domain